MNLRWTAPQFSARTRLFVRAALLLVSGCRGNGSELPPIRPIRDMFQQPKLRPQASSGLFHDGTSTRPPPRGSAPQEQSQGPDDYATGTDANGYLETIPQPVDEAMLARGEERYGIFCVPCHDRSGAGRGPTVRRGFPQPIELSSDHTRALADGELFRTIGFGIGNMPGHRAQVPVADRWAIVAWVRVLQRAQRASLAELRPARPDSPRDRGGNR